MSREIPILFSTEMVQAILAGRKTMTRRVVKDAKNIEDAKWGFTAFTPERHISVRGIHENGDYGESFVKMKWCAGDVLWVRENWRVHYWNPEEHEVTVGFCTGDGAEVVCSDLDETMLNRLWEQSCDDLAKAGYELDPDEGYEDYDFFDLRVRPSIHMPKDAARIWLRVKRITVERVWDITRCDAIDEGVRFHQEDEAYYDYLNAEYTLDSKASFKSLWEKINGRESWDSNPWVWVVEFEVLSVTGRPAVEKEVGDE